MASAYRTYMDLPPAGVKMGALYRAIPGPLLEDEGATDKPDSDMRGFMFWNYLVLGCLVALIIIGATSIAR